MSEPISIADSVEASEREEANDQLLQFNLSLLFSLITLGAFVAAIITPILRDAENISYGRIAFFLGLQLIGMVTYCLWALKRRKKMLSECGQRLGIGYCGVLRWRHWPFIKSWMSTLFVSLIQFGLALLFSTLPLHPGMFMYWIYLIQLGIHSGMVFSNLLWKNYPSSITFYENGILSPMKIYLPWDKVTVRPSRLYPDRMVVVIHPDANGMLGDTKVVQAPRALRERVQHLAAQCKEVAIAV